MTSHQPRAIQALLDQAPPAIREDWAEFTSSTVMEGVWARIDYLGARERRIVTLSILITLGMPNELRLHLRMAFRQGFSDREIGELIMHASVYAGFPKGVEAMRIANEVIDELGS